MQSSWRPAILVLALPAAQLHAQAPPAADFWRVTTASLTGAAAFETGTVGVFWNPAPAREPSGLTLGVEMVQTSEALGLSGLLAGAGYSVGPLVQVGLLYGRMQVRDLIRTTTSPTSVGGDIPVYEQLLGANVGARLDRFQAGLLLAYHAERFDQLDESGLTVDAGVRVAVHRRVNLAAATHFFPVTFSRQETTDYYLGAEVVAGDSVPFAGGVARVVLQVGTTYRGSGNWEYTVAGGLTVARVVRVETAVTSEAAYGQRFLRLGVGVSLFIGRYGIGLAAGSGQNDVGGTYRVGIDAQLVK